MVDLKGSKRAKRGRGSRVRGGRKNLLEKILRGKKKKLAALRRMEKGTETGKKGEREGERTAML